MNTKTIAELCDEIALKKYGKVYSALPDDGAEQDYVAGEAGRVMAKQGAMKIPDTIKPKCSDLSQHDLASAVQDLDSHCQTNFARLGKFWPHDFRDMAAVARAYYQPGLAEIFELAERGEL